MRKKRALELTYEFCKQIASNFNTRNELKHGDPSVYNKCRQKGWIFDFFPEVVYNKPYEKADFLAYVEKNGPEKLYKNNRSLYNLSREKGWYWEYVEKWQPVTKEDMEEASRSGLCRTDFRRVNPKVFHAMSKDNLLDYYFPITYFGGWSRSNFVKCSRRKPTPSILYIINLRSDSESFYKIGITTQSLKQRFYCLPYSYNLIWYIQGPPKVIFNLEREIFQDNRSHKYNPNQIFGGSTECFSNEPEFKPKYLKNPTMFRAFELLE